MTIYNPSVAATVVGIAGPAGTPFSSKLPNVGLTVTQPQVHRIYQRLTVSNGLYGLGQGKIPFSISVTLPTLSLDYRLRDAVASGNPTLQDWTPAAYALPAGNSIVNLLNVPARAGWYYVDLRPNGDSSQILLGTNPVGMGELVVGYGQSLMVDFINPGNVVATTLASLGITPNPNTAILGSYVGNSGAEAHYPAAWALPADGTDFNSAGSTTMMNLLAASLNVNIGFVAQAHNGQPISTFASGTADYTELVANITAAGGVFGTLIFLQGHTDAQNGTTQATYKTALTNIITAIATAFPTLPFYRIIQTIPSLISAATGTPAQIEAIREAAILYVAGDSLATYVDGLDVALDAVTSPVNIHPTQAGMVTQGQEFYRAIMAKHGFVTPHYGPSITGASRAASSATIQLAIAQDGGTGLVGVGTIANQFTVYNGGTTSSPLAISAVNIISATEVDIVLSAAPANSQAVDVWYRLPPDTAAVVSSGIYDNNTVDGLPNGRQLRMSALAITAAAPNASSPSITINTPTTVAVGSPLTLTGTYSNYTPTAMDYQENGSGGFTALTSFTASGGTWSGVGPTYSATATGQTITVEDHTTASIAATTGSFSVPTTAATKNLTMTSPVYATGKFSQGIDSGYGLAQANFLPATGFTAEFWAKTDAATSPSSVKVAVGQYPMFFVGAGNNGSGNAYFNVALTSSGNTNGFVIPVTGVNICDGNFHHLAIVIMPTLVACYVDGTQVGNYACTPSFNETNQLGVHDFGGLTGFAYPGVVDEVAIFSGQRYSGSTYTVPTAAYTGSEANLLALWHLDGNGTGAV